LTSTIRNSPTRLRSEFNGKMGEICFDQISAVDKSSITKILGTVSEVEKRQVNILLRTMFGELLDCLINCHLYYKLLSSFLYSPHGSKL
jgi:hypothetical protein